jgi:Amt family ammonium transporter
MITRSLKPMLLGAALASGAVPALAADSTVNTGDTAWMLTSSALVLFMTPGLAFFYGGMVRNKNVVSTIMQSFIACAIVTLAWFAVGYSMAFGPTRNGFLGSFDWAFLSGVTTTPNGDYGATIPHSLFMVYQCMFAIITPALITGTIAERVTFKGYLVFLLGWSLFIYCPLAHWVWGVGGWLRGMGVLDFAGGYVVHLSAGSSALAAALVFGKRADYGTADTSPSSIPLIAIGTGILWFGWFGFNGGSAIGSSELAVTAFVNTHLAAASATLGWMLVDWFVKGKPSLTGACIGAVVGLVAITPASGFVAMQAAVVIGFLAGTIPNAVAVARGKSQIDDSLDVIACHGVGGTIGVLCTGLFAQKVINAAGADGGATLFFVQLKAAAIVATFCFIGTYILLKFVQVVTPLRPTAEDEARGLDASEHNEKAYSCS